ncbi:hypothetical protein H257_15328 [Aphanomyces astaci]|uniref:Uncharacterized protein n=1 Tax=Aphanomyces astaci TaxID=112090 RepID=W4FPY9_APHAT|nr:hypothetical protein H257_15328 [Aphanomyces astaci]ETV68743.1 hypothetical protein H257_15328 [Aphanomyces astaci]|eukprot:XP_009841697.1 hypothetical protein H257_15328 [Aphanomyces astaci]
MGKQARVDNTTTPSPTNAITSACRGREATDAAPVSSTRPDISTTQQPRKHNEHNAAPGPPSKKPLPAQKRKKTNAERNAEPQPKPKTQPHTKPKPPNTATQPSQDDRQMRQNRHKNDHSQQPMRNHPHRTNSTPQPTQHATQVAPSRETNTPDPTNHPKATSPRRKPEAPPHKQACERHARAVTTPTHVKKDVSSGCNERENAAAQHKRTANTFKTQATPCKQPKTQASAQKNARHNIYTAPMAHPHEQNHQEPAKGLPLLVRKSKQGHTSNSNERNYASEIKPRTTTNDRNNDSTRGDNHHVPNPTPKMCIDRNKNDQPQRHTHTKKQMPDLQQKTNQTQQRSAEQATCPTNQDNVSHDTPKTGRGTPPRHTTTKHEPAVGTRRRKATTPPPPARPTTPTHSARRGKRPALPVAQKKAHWRPKANHKRPPPPIQRQTRRNNRTPQTDQ